MGLAIIAIYFSGIPHLRKQFSLMKQWQAASDTGKQNILHGSLSNLFILAKDKTHPDSRILLFSQVDPALIPYYLYPRVLYQVQPDPETNRSYMNLSASPYPLRHPQSFEVDWHIRCLVDNRTLKFILQSKKS